MCSESPESCRVFIGLELEARFVEFKEMMEIIYGNSSKPRMVLLGNVVGCLLENDRIEVSMWMDPLQRDAVIRAVTEGAYGGRRSSGASAVQHMCMHRLRSSEQASRAMATFGSRIYDRRTHVGVMPNGGLTILSAPDTQRNCVRIRNIPDFDPTVHNQQFSEELQERFDRAQLYPTPPPPVQPIAIPVGPNVTPDQPQTAAMPSTSSTAASTGLLNIFGRPRSSNC